MTFVKASSLTMGFAAAFALGVWVAPHVHREMRASSAAPAGDLTTAVTSRTAPTRAVTSPSSSARPVTRIAVTAPELQQRLKPLFHQGTDMSKAAAGFHSAEQFATMAYASNNTEVPFVVLKYRVLDEGKTLTSSIHESRPRIRATAEVERAKAQARSTLASIGS
jgi:hypothetical protein